MSSEPKLYRLVTRSDFDGLVCAVLLKHMDLLGDILFAHPKDVQDGKVPIGENDIVANLPYCNKAHLVFDHHWSEMVRVSSRASNHIIDPDAPSAARVVFDYFGGFESFPLTWDQMMIAVDKSDAAQFARDEILYPERWTLLSFIMDARTGLGRFRNFDVSNYQLMHDLIDYCRFNNIEEILKIPDVQDRVKLYHEHAPLFREQLDRCAQKFGDLVVLDLRNEVTIHPGNRFMIYALNPDVRLSMHVMWGVKGQNTVFALGKSIIDRSSPLNIGELMLEYGGGGHKNAGTCQTANERAAEVLEELVGRITGTKPDYQRPFAKPELQPNPFSQH
jgi:nanoRNase/pAp phosphatase (c-di-AMP/oligoRNAs hydrolase)